MIKYIDIKEFRATGFLQDANRQFFHPHGLALEVTIVDEEFQAKKYREIFDNTGLVGDPYTSAQVKELVEDQWPLGSEFISGVWDDRDDPEGVWFDFPVWSDYREGHPFDKAHYVASERTRHLDARATLFEKHYGPYCSGEFPDLEPFVWEEDNENSHSSD